MASSHDSNDTHGHDSHGHDDHGHEDHATGGDIWVVIPLAVGLVIGLILAVYFGLDSSALPIG